MADKKIVQPQVTQEEGNRDPRKVFVGIVTSIKMQKTIVVEVERKFAHARIGKLVVRHKKYHVHDEENVCKVGDKVEIMETKPISKTKFYRLLRIVEKAK